MIRRPPRSTLLSLHDALPICLAESADVLLETFRPGVMARLGVGYKILAKRNPRLVYCALSGRKVSDRKSTRLNSSHQIISYAVFFLKKKKKHQHYVEPNADWR